MLEVVVVVLAVVGVTLDQQKLGAAEQRIEVDQHLTPQLRQLGQQRPCRRVAWIEPPAGLGRYPARAVVQPLQQLAGRILATVRVAEFLDRRTEPGQIAAERGQYGSLDAQVQPATVPPEAFAA